MIVPYEGEQGLLRSSPTFENVFISPDAIKPELRQGVNLLLI